MSLADEIKRLRAASGLSQQRLADLLKVNQSFVAKLETGKATGIGADVLYRLCDALGVSADHFRPFLIDSGDGTGEEQASRSQRKPK